MPRRTKTAASAPPPEETAPAAEETAPATPPEDVPHEGLEEVAPADAAPGDAPDDDPAEKADVPEEAPAEETADERKARRKAAREARQAETDVAEANGDAPAKNNVVPLATIEATPLDEQDDYLKGLWYGRGGSGKTTDMLTVTNLPDKGKVLVINAEAGLKPTALRARGVDTSRIVMWPDARKGETLTYAGLEAAFNTVSADLQADPDSWCATVWDSGTEIVQLLLDDKVKTAFDAQEERIRKSTAGRPGNARKRFQTEGEDYGEVGQEVKYLIRKFKFLPCHFLWSCLERNFENKDTGRSYVGPNVNPALADAMIGYFDVVIRTAVFVDDNNKSTWTGRTAPSQHEEGKDRYGVLPINMVNPSVERIYEYIVQELNEDNDPERTGEGVDSALRKTEERATTGRPASTRKKASTSKAAAKTSEAPAEEPEKASA